MASGISVIICCYNSSLRLNETLKHLINQKISGFDSEIIIVDNASTDDTEACAHRILTGGKDIDFTIVREPESGLSNARKRGYSVAKYEYLLFCDDDNWLADNYLQLTYKTMGANSKIGILGGHATAVFEIAEPVWFKQYQLDFAVGEQPGCDTDLSQVKEVYGAGFTIRKSYLDKLYSSGFRSILSGRKGNQLISGDDSELCYLAKYFGFEVWYYRKLRLQHFMTKGRLNWSYLKRLYQGKGKTLVYTLAYQYVETHKRAPAQNLRLPFWLDTFIYKTKQILKFYAEVKHKMNNEGDPDVLRYIAMKAEAREIWNLKGKYSQLFNDIIVNQNAGRDK